MAERFNPYKHFIGSFIPNWLMEQTAISPGAKLCYSRLAQFADKETGMAWPSIETLAEKLGSGERQVSRYLNELRKENLIESERVGTGNTNHYFFLEHEGMAGSTLTHLSGHTRHIRQVTPSTLNSLRESEEEENQISIEAQDTQKKETRVTRITMGFIEEMVNDYTGPLGHPSSVRDEIHKAMGHKSADRYKDKRMWLRNWLNNALEYRARQATYQPSPGRQTDDQYEHLIQR